MGKTVSFCEEGKYFRQMYHLHNRIKNIKIKMNKSSHIWFHTFFTYASWITKQEVFYIFDFRSAGGSECQAKNKTKVSHIFQLPQHKWLMSPEHLCLQHMLLITHSQKLQLDLPASPNSNKSSSTREFPDESLITAKTFLLYMWNAFKKY